MNKKPIDSEIINAFDDLLNRKWIIAKSGDKFITMGDVADLLNRLQEENELLNARVGIYETCNARKDEAIRHLEAEIEKLKDISDNKTKELLRYNASIEELHKKLETVEAGGGK